MDLLVGDLVSFLAAARLELEEHSLWQLSRKLLCFISHIIISIQCRPGIIFGNYNHISLAEKAQPSLLCYRALKSK